MVKKLFVIVHPDEAFEGLDFFLESIPEELKERFEIISCDGSDEEIEDNCEKISNLKPAFIFFMEEMNPRYGTTVLYDYTEILNKEKADDDIPILSHFDLKKKHGGGLEDISKYLDSYKKTPNECIGELINYLNEV